MIREKTARPVEKTDLACTPLKPEWYCPQAVGETLRPGVTSSARNLTQAALAASRPVPLDSARAFLSTLARALQAAWTAGSIPSTPGLVMSASSACPALSIGTNVPQA